jgi:cholesterol oxidase
MGTHKSVSFTEDMHGFVASTPQDFTSKRADFLDLAKAGELKKQELKFRLTIFVENIDEFINDKDLKAKSTGYIESSIFGGRQEVVDGDFNLFLYPSSSKKFDAAKEMHYTLKFLNDNNEEFLFYGYKVLQKEDGLEIWEETTTLYTQIFKGYNKEELLYAGVLRLNIEDFIKQMGTFNSNAQTIFQRLECYYKFLNVFSENVWEAYAHQLFGKTEKKWNEHIFPVNTTKGVQNAEITLHSFDTDDGISLQFQRFKRKECKDVVVLLHGLTNSTDMFIMPEHYNFVSYLLNNEYTDVVSVDWRGSKRFTYNLIPNRYNFDYVAKYDLPRAIEEIKKKIGPEKRIHIVAHCVGSICASLSLASGQLKGISSFTSNSVSLTPKVPWQTKVKMVAVPFLVEYILRYPYLSPKIPYMSGPAFGKWLPLMHRLLRHECDEPACHMLSTMWGWGFPACYEHSNLSEITHRRLYDFFGGCGVHWYRHVRKMIFAKEAIPYEKKMDFIDLPDSYLQNVKEVNFPKTLLLSGTKNKIFPGSNKETLDRIKEISPKTDVQYQEIENYGHLDVFIGKNIHIDVFPRILDFLKSVKE